jgi:hypothetical protein
LIEIDPRYVDVTITRWRNLTGRTAVRADAETPCENAGQRRAVDAPATIAAKRQAEDGAKA